MKHHVMLAGMIVLLAVGSCASPRPSNKFGVPNPVERRIRTWQEDNDIELSEEAFGLLAEQLGTACENCSETYHFKSDGSLRSGGEHARVAVSSKSQGGTKIPGSTEQTHSHLVTPPAGEFHQALLDYYLDQLRDINMAKGKRAVIESADILAYTFQSFINDIGVMRMDSFGRLVVTSDPKFADIKIDGKRKGYTVKRFVVEAGTHRVEVSDPHLKLSCNETVVIEDFEVQTVTCRPPPK